MNGGQFRQFLTKLKGVPGMGPLPRPPVKHVAASFIGAVVGVGSLSAMHQCTGSTEATILVGSSGATAVLLFAAPTLPFSQPRNVIGGHMVAAISGTGINYLLGDVAIAPALSVGLAVAGMQMTSTLHPPAGGTALIAAMAGQSPFFIVPVFVGSVAQVGCACVYNNLIADRRYPQYW